MNPTRLRAATCSSCGGELEVELSRGIDGRRMGNARERILAGTYQVQSCPRCNDRAVYERPFIFTDFERGEYIAMETSRSATPQTALARHETLFRDSFDFGPPVAQELGARLKKRIVYGFAALREKLMVWDAGLDDRIVEAVKGDVLAREEYDVDEVVLRVSVVLDGGHISFAVYEPVPLPPDDLPADQPWIVPARGALDFVLATADMYQLRAHEPSKIARDYPWIGEDWLVDVHDGPSYMYR